MLEVENFIVQKVNKKQFALWFQREKLFDINEKLYLEKLVIERTINCFYIEKIYSFNLIFELFS